MSNICVNRHVEFEAAHMLFEYNGACRNLHGHSYALEVTVEGPQDNNFGFVLDFKILDSILKDVIPDHYFISNKQLPENCPERQIVKILKNNNMAVMEYDFEPSAENMVKNFAKEIQEQLYKHNISANVVEVKLWETTNSYAIWKKEK